jgi:hypothetical protein
MLGFCSLSRPPFQQSWKPRPAHSS